MLLTLLTTYAAFVVETSVVPRLGCGEFAPRVVLATLVCFVWRQNGRAGLWTAAVWGLLSDGLSTGPLGIDVVLFVLSAAGVQLIRDRAHDSPLTVGLIAGLTALVVPVAGTVIRQSVERHQVEWERLVFAAAPSVGSTALLTIASLIAFRSMLGRRTNRDDEPTASVSNRWSMLTE